MSTTENMEFLRNSTVITIQIYPCHLKSLGTPNREAQRTKRKPEQTSPGHQVSIQHCASIALETSGLFQGSTATSGHQADPGLTT